MAKNEPGLVAGDAALNAIPGEAYAAQRAQGFRLLRFSPPLENEYLAQMRADQRGSAQVCTATALLIWLGFAGLDLLRLDLSAEFEARHHGAFIIIGFRAATLAVLALLLACLVSKRLQATYPRLCFVSLVMIGLTAAVSANIYKMRELPQADLAEFAIIMAAFLPVGLTYRQSLATAGLITLIAAAAGYTMLDAPHLPAHARLSVMLVLAAFVGAIGAYLREYAQRDQFLLSQLVHHFAMHDPLTGIGNRRYFEERATTALKQAQRERAAVTFAILDIDHFKSFNDRYGHHAGDQALKQVARRITQCLRRPLDLAGRLGGEEFGILLYGAAPDEARSIIENIATSVAELGIGHDTSPTSAFLTVSVGAARFDGTESLESLYRRADIVLYASKAAGRNRALFEQTGPPLPGWTPPNANGFETA